MGQALAPAELRILLVEDNDLLAGVAAGLLESLGYSVAHCAPSAEEALDWMHHGGEFDLLVTDIIMPGMNGVDLAVHVRADHPDIPVLLTTGYGEALLVEQQRHFPVLSKPFRSAEISQAIG
ncbi:MAG: response regulator, partial [Sphingomonadaceae bacterium]